MRETLIHRHPEEHQWYLVHEKAITKTHEYSLASDAFLIDDIADTLPIKRCAAMFGEDEHTEIRLQRNYQHESGRENGLRANMLQRNNETNSSSDERCL